MGAGRRSVLRGGHELTVAGPSGSPPPGGARPHPYLLPAAIAVGSALIACAAYFGLTKDCHCTCAPPAASERAHAPPESTRSSARVARSFPPPPAVGSAGATERGLRTLRFLHESQRRRGAAFQTLWQRHHRAVAVDECGLPDILKHEGVRQLRTPIALAIAADGSVTRATASGPTLVVRGDGAAPDKTIQLDCYLRYIEKKVRFLPADKPSELRVDLLLDGPQQPGVMVPGFGR